MKKLLLIILFISCLLGTTVKAQYWTKNGTGLSASGVCVIDLSVPEDKVALGILSVFSSGSCGGIVPYYTKTTNGSTWNAGLIPLLPNITPVCISAISATKAWILASDISTNKVGYVYQTTNGGTTWNIQNSSYSSDAGRFIHFFDANEGITVGDSSIFRTMDGGVNWIPNGALPVDTSFLGSGTTNLILNSYEVVGNS